MNLEGVGFPVLKEDKISVGLISFGNSEIRAKQTEFHVKHQISIAEAIGKKFEASMIAVPIADMKTKEDIENYLRVKIESVENKALSLEELMKGVTPENTHPETDCGPSVGQEIW